MSWMSKLYETYENSQSKIGEIKEDGKIPLLPIGFTIKDAHIEVTLNINGNFLGARALDKTEKMTIIPCTEDSDTRSGSGSIPHPLFDKLQYIAGDYETYVEKNGNKYFSKYINQLSDWCCSPYQNPKILSIFRYLKKECLITDLINANVLWCDNNGKLMKKWEGEKNNVPPIFKVVAASQKDAFVRFLVVGDGLEAKVWMDKSVQKGWQDYYLSKQDATDICYVTGSKIPCIEKHASKIRNTADKAKLISANDSSGFTYRGRFGSSKEAVSIGYDVSQKAHNTLRWLISRQGYHNGDQVILVWGTHNQKIPLPLNDVESFLAQNDEIEVMPVYTEQEYAMRLNSAVTGYKQNLNHSAQIVIMVLNAATTGRLSILYYREIGSNEYLNRIQNWYQSCSWWFTYQAKDKKTYITTIGTPVPREILFAAYGDKANDSLKQSTIERLLPCIIDQTKIPYDLVKNAVRRASNPVIAEKWEWNKTLSVACALYKKHNEGMNYSMALEKERNDRAYLYGRLLAAADKIEGMTYTAGENRQTNAMQYMNMFSQSPFRTWKIIAERLVPYEAKLGVRCKKYIDLITEIHSQFTCDDFKRNDSLDGLYLLGFYCQRQVFIDEQKEAKEKLQQQKIK